jgi:ubiquitin-conjugating enzyme E2 Q
VIVSIRSLISVGEGRLEAALKLEQTKYDELLAAAQVKSSSELGASSNDDINADKLHERSLIDDDKVAAIADSTNSRVESQKYNHEDDAYDAANAKIAFNYISGLHTEEGWSDLWCEKG